MKTQDRWGVSSLLLFKNDAAEATKNSRSVIFKTCRCWKRAWYLKISWNGADNATLLLEWKSYLNLLTTSKGSSLGTGSPLDGSARHAELFALTFKTPQEYIRTVRGSYSSPTADIYEFMTFLCAFSIGLFCPQVMKPFSFRCTDRTQWDHLLRGPSPST